MGNDNELDDGKKCRDGYASSSSDEDIGGPVKEDPNQQIVQVLNFILVIS